jgi:hypothetical protein
MTDALLSDEALHEIEQLLIDGRTIEAIKVYREVTGADLRTAKEAIDALAAEIRGAGDPSSKPIGPSGCAVILAAVTSSLATALAFAL